MGETSKTTSNGIDAIWEDMKKYSKNGDVMKIRKKIPGNCKINPKSYEKKNIKKGIQKDTHENFNLIKELNRLSDENSIVRKKAALALEREYLSQRQVEKINEDIQEMAKTLFKRFNDPIEKVREVCIRLSTIFMAQQEDLMMVVPYMMPAVINQIDASWEYDEENQVFTRDQYLHDAFKRGRVYVSDKEVSRMKPNEPSEEIRLLMVKLIDAMLSNAFKRKAGSLLHAYIYDVILILVNGTADNFHEINIKSCEVLCKISDNMVSVMKHFSVGLVRSLKGLLIHRLSRVRIAAIKCTQTLVACPNFEKCKGSGTEAIADLIGHRDENILPISAFYSAEVSVNIFAKLDQDTNVQVRKVFYAMVADWLKNLPDRYDHESRLMPYLISGVSDECPEIACESMQAIEFLGKRYEREYSEEILEKKQYGVDGNPDYNYSKPFPPPFFNRPKMGTRLYVRSRCRRFLNTLLRELHNWQTPTRLHAARLLKCVIIYSEENITVDFHLLCNTLLKGWKDKDIRPHLQEIAELCGRFSTPDIYMDFMLGNLQEDSNGGHLLPSHVANTLDVLDCLMDGALEKNLLGFIPSILQALSMSDVLDYESASVKCGLAKLILRVAQLLEGRDKDAISAYFLQHGRLSTIEVSYEQLILIATVLVNGEAKSPWLEDAKQTIMRVMRLQDFKNCEDMYSFYFSKFFPNVATKLKTRAITTWSYMNYENILFQQLLVHASPSVLSKNIHELQSCFSFLLKFDSSDCKNKILERQSVMLQSLELALQRFDCCDDAYSVLKALQSSCEKKKEQHLY